MGQLAVLSCRTLERSFSPFLPGCFSWPLLSKWAGMDTAWTIVLNSGFYWSCLTNLSGVKPFPWEVVLVWEVKGDLGQPCDRDADGALLTPALPQPPPLSYTHPCSVTLLHIISPSLTFSPFCLHSFPLLFSPFLFVLVLLFSPATSVYSLSTFNQNLTSAITIILVLSPSRFY